MDSLQSMTVHDELKTPESERNRGLLIIPCYNESLSLPDLLEEVKQADIGLDVLVINDGSSDSTAIEAQRANILLIDLPCNLGVGHALQSGFKYAVEHGYDFVIRIDGDGQHPPSEVAKLMSFAETSDADLIVGSRFSGNNQMISSPLRYLGIKMLSCFMSLICRAKIDDPTSGFWLVRNPLLKYFAMEFPTDYPEPEALALLRRQGYAFVSIPVSFRPRNKGVSSIRSWGAFYYTVKVGLALVVDRVRPVNRAYARDALE